MHFNIKVLIVNCIKKDTRVSMEGVRRPDNPSDYKSEPDSYFPSTFLSQLFSLKRTLYSVALVVIVSVSLFALHVLISYTISTEIVHRAEHGNCSLFLLLLSLLH